jgi:hypothetical protein
LTRGGRRLLQQFLVLWTQSHIETGSFCYDDLLYGYFPYTRILETLVQVKRIAPCTKFERPQRKVMEVRARPPDEARV